MKIHGVRTFTKDITIEIIPAYFVSDEELFKDAQKIKRFLMSYIPVRTYEYLQKLLEEKE